MAAKKPIVLTPQGEFQQLRVTDWLENLQVGVDIQEYSETLDDISALTGLGLVRKTASGVETRELVVEANSGLVLDLTDPEEIGLALQDVTLTNTGAFVKITVDAKGRVTGTTPVTAADITALVPTTNFVLKTGDTLSGDLNFNNAATVTGLQDPTDPQDAATKSYVDSVATGLKIKDAVKVATTENLVGTYLNGSSGVNATFVIDPGVVVIDGLTIGVDLQIGDAILIKNQTAALQNGRYTIADISDGTTTPTTFVRASDFDEPSEIQSAYVFVEGGITQQATGWTASVPDPSDIEIGTTPITFSQFSGSASFLQGNGILITGNTISASLKPNAGLAFDNGDIAVVADPNKGLELTSTGVGIKLVPTTSGLTVTSAGLAVSAGNGLQVTGGALTVQTSTNSGLNVDANGASVQLRTNSGLSTTAAGLGVVADATSGLSVGASGITIANGALPIAKLASSGITIAADTGTSTAVALGGTLTINGNATSGVDTTYAAGVVTVTTRTASASQRGTIRIGSGLLIDANGVVSVDFPVVSRNATVDTYTAGEAITAGSAVYFDSGTNRILNAENVTNIEVIGIAATDIANGAVGDVVLGGNVTLTGLTNGASYFLGATPGTITPTVPTSGWLVPIGKATNGKLLVRIGTAIQL